MAEPVNGEDVSDFICSICLLVPFDPCILGCGHLFCEDCIEKTKKTSCPVCTRYFHEEDISFFNDMDENPFLRRLWSKIEVKCYKDNCGWTGQITDLKMHLQSCVVVENKKLRAEKQSLINYAESLEKVIGDFQAGIGECKSSKRKFESLK